MGSTQKAVGREQGLREFDRINRIDRIGGRERRGNEGGRGRRGEGEKGREEMTAAKRNQTG